MEEKMEDKDLEYSVEQLRKEFYKSIGIPEEYLTEVQSDSEVNSLPLLSFKFKLKVWWVKLKIKLELIKLIWRI